MADQNQARSYVGLRDLTDASKLANKRWETELLRGRMKRDWALNRSYYEGNQWSFWNPQMVRVEDLPIDSGPKWKVRLVDNQIKPGLAHFVAQLTKTRPIIEAEPDSGGDTDVKAAEYAEALFEYLFDDLHLNAKVQDALVEAGLSGGYWRISWDPLAGKQMTFVVDQQGNPIVDDELASAYVDELEKVLTEQGQQAELADQIAKRTVYVGDIRVDVMPAENVLLDPAAERFEDCNWAICRHMLDPDEIQARFGVQTTPNLLRTADQPLPFAQDQKPPNMLREIFVMYVRPCPSLPKGRYVVWIEGPNQILQDKNWPYPFTELPLVKFPGRFRSGSAYDDALVTDIRPLQKDLNKTLSQIVEHKNLTVRPQMLAPIGSLRQKLTSEPGAVFEYNPVGNAVPQWREMPSIPQYVFEHLQNLQERIDRAFNRLPSTRDSLPPRTDSGQLLEAMQEGVADQLSPIIIRLEDALARAGHLMAAYAQAYYEEPRLLKIRGAGGSIQVKKFQGADIAGGFTFRPRYGTGLPRTRAGKQMAIMQLVEAQLIDPKTAMKHLDLSDLKGVQAQIARDEDMAFREHDKILRGQGLNRQAVQDAQSQIQQFQQQAQQIMQELQAGQPVDIDGDGQPDDPQQVVQQLQQQFQQMQQQLQDAPWQPLDYEDFDTHLEVHGQLLKSVEFETYPPDVQDIFIKHWHLTYQKRIEIMEATPDPTRVPKINLRLQGTTSAPVMTKLLSKAGIATTEDEVAQLPLDTQVIDTLDKPNANPAGNDPVDSMSQALTMQQAQDAHELSQAKAVQAMGLAEQRAATQEQMQSQQMQQAQQQHEARLQQQQQMHQARVKQANKPKPKPKAGK